jgi:ASPIC/UnbV protein/VCBS repeat protein
VRIRVQAPSVIAVAPLLALLSATGSASDHAPEAPVVFTDIALTAFPGLEDVRTFGVCVGAFRSDDQLDDVYVGDHLVPPALLLNTGNLSFRPWAQAGLSQNSDFHGCAWADYDKDGDLDLYQTQGADKGLGFKSNFLYRNDGATLTDVAEQAGVSDPSGRGRSVAWLDYDNDGQLDIYLANSARPDGPDVLFRNNGDGTFTNTAAQAGVADTTHTESATLTDFDGDGDVDFFTTGSRVSLYQNRGDGTFADVTAPSGLLAAGIQNSADSAWGDFDADGDPDLFVVSTDSLGDDVVLGPPNLIAFETRIDNNRDPKDGLNFTATSLNATFDIFLRTNHASPDHIFIGQQGAHPKSVPFTLGLPGTPSLSGRPQTVPSTLDNAILIWRDAGVWSMETLGHTQESGLARVFWGTITTIHGSFSSVEPYDFEWPDRTGRNYLFENRGDGTFEDVTDAAGVAYAGPGRSILSADFDNDGDLDLYVVRSGVALDAPDSFYENAGDGTFVEIGAAVGLGTPHPGNGDSAAYGDFDADGFLDILTTHGNDLNSGPYALWHNEGNGNNWVRFRLVGTASNASGIGARVTVHTAGGEQVREQNGGFHRYSQSDMFVHFGLGAETAVEWARIDWPSGQSQTIDAPQVNATIEVVEPAPPLPAPRPRRAADPRRLDAPPRP